MTTIDVDTDEKKKQHQTEYSIYHHDDVDDKLIDFTEKKLLAIINHTSNSHRRIALIKLLQTYRKREVIIAWREGVPVYVSVERKE